MTLIKGRMLAVLGIVAAYILIIPVWVAYLLGRIRIHWDADAKEAWKSRGVLVIANHPSLIETIVLPALFWHPAWLGSQHRIPWSVADEHLFGNRPWIYEAFRCIVVSRKQTLRSTRQNVEMRREVMSRLGKGGRVLLYPEGGRTCKGESWIYEGDRRVRHCNATLVRYVLSRGFKVVPIWIDHGTVLKPESFWHGYQKLFFGPKFHIYFGPPMPDNTTTMTWAVEEAILKAGK